MMAIAGCERYDDLEVDIPYKPKIVTACFLQGLSDEVQVAVTRSQPVFNVEPKPGFEPAPEYIKDATVILHQGFNVYPLHFDSTTNFYYALLPSTIQAGQKFELTVTTGNETSEGSTIIPGKVNANVQMKFDSTLQYDGLYQYRATVTCTPTDPGKHYLEFYPILYYADSSMALMDEGTFATITTLNQGQSVTKTFFSTVSMNGVPPVRLEFMIVNGDEGYAKNSKSVFDLTGGFGFSPFIDPAITYTNMTGGIGITGSYNPETRYVFNLK